MAEEQKKDLPGKSASGIMSAYIDEKSAEINWGELGTDETPALLRCKVEYGKPVLITIEWPPGKKESFKAP